MRNLAGERPEVATAEVRDELEAADIPSESFDPDRREVQARVRGRLVVGERTFVFERAWVYWTVKATPPIPVPEAQRIYDAPFACGSGTRYSNAYGSDGKLGGVARAYGHCGSPRPGEDGWGEVHSWHIDTIGALCRFVRKVRAPLDRQARPR